MHPIQALNPFTRTFTGSGVAPVPQRDARRRARAPFSVVAAAALLFSGGAWATEYGTVLSSTPVTAQVAVPQSQCNDEPALVQQPPSGVGSLLGAVVGGVVGNQFGSGAGRAAATGLGAVAGSVVGNNIESANNPPAATTVRRCRTVSRYENRLVGYDVTYEYNGQRYTTRMAQDPGSRIALNVNVAPQGALAQAPGQSPLSGTPVGEPLYREPVYTEPAYPAPVYAAPYYAGPPVVYAPPPAYYGYAPGVAIVPRIWIGGYWRHR